jgi:CRP/FNR family transcriptional regulator
MGTVAAIQFAPPSRNANIARAQPVLRDVSRNGTHCSDCKQQNICLWSDLGAETMREVDRLVTTRVRFRKGETLYRAGSPFAMLYAIRSGSCKTVMPGEDGRDQVAGYHMPGEIMGADGIGNDSYQCHAIALEDSEVCALPFDRLEQLARHHEPFQRNLHRLLSREIARQHSLLLALGTMRADQRLSEFLLDLSRRYDARGYSPSEFVLRMTREEIGSYLGLKLETVSRLLSRFQREGLIQVQGRTVKLLDRAAMRALLAEAL